MSAVVRGYGGGAPPFFPTPSRSTVPPQAPSALDRRRTFITEYLAEPTTCARLAAAVSPDLDDLLCTSAPRLEQEGITGDLRLEIPWLGRRRARAQRDNLLRTRAKEALERLHSEIEDAKIEWKWYSGNLGEKRADTPDEAARRAAEVAAIERDLQERLTAEPVWTFDERTFGGSSPHLARWRDRATGVTIEGEREPVAVIMALEPREIRAEEVLRRRDAAGGSALVILDGEDLSRDVAEELDLAGVPVLKLGAAFNRWLSERDATALAAEEL